MADRICQAEGCNNSLLGKRLDAKYCSVSCGQRGWEKENKEKSREKYRKHYKKNRERENERSRKWREANKERKRELNRKYREENREKYREYQRKYKNNLRHEAEFRALSAISLEMTKAAVE